MPVVMPTVTGTRATVAWHAGKAPKRYPAERDGGGKMVRSYKNP